MYKNIFQTHKSEEYIHTKQRVSDSCPQGLLDDILGYFLERNEDE